jgi:hypothetical protein
MKISLILTNQPSLKITDILVTYIFTSKIMFTACTNNHVLITHCHEVVITEYIC